MLGAGGKQAHCVHVVHVHPACKLFLTPLLLVMCPTRMSAKGFFSHKGDDTVTCFSVTVNGALVHLRLAPVDVAVARIYATDEQGNPQPMHPAITLREVESGAVFGPRREEFLITWMDSFVLSVNGVDSIWLTTPKQFDITTADGSTPFSI